MHDRIHFDVHFHREKNILSHGENIFVINLRL